MEDPLTADDPVRGGVAAEEEEARPYGQQYLTLPTIQWSNSEQSPVEPELLVVAEGLAAAILMECCVQPKQVVGTIELLQIQRPSGDGLPRKELAAHSATIYQVASEVGGAPGGAVLLVASTSSVPPERSVAWTRGLLSSVRPTQLAVVSAMPAAQFRGAGDAAEEVLLYSVSTTAARESPAASGADLQTLPSGTLVSGVAAAVIQHREIRREAAVALVGVQMAPVPDQTYLHGLAAGVGKLMHRLAGEQVSQLWQPDKAAIRQAVIRCDRAYRGSAASLLYT